MHSTCEEKSSTQRAASRFAERNIILKKAPPTGAFFMVPVFITDFIPSSPKNQSEAQRSGFDLEGGAAA